MCNRVTLGPREALVAECCSGGGYGDPAERDPELVCHRVAEGWLSRHRARDVYGVVVTDASRGELRVDAAATEELRSKRSAEPAVPE